MHQRPAHPVIAAIVLPLILLALVALPALALPSGQGWSRLETENFSLFSNLDEAGTREIGIRLERLRTVLMQLFPDASFSNPVPSLMYLFADRDSFAPYSLTGGEGSGFFVPHIHANFAAIVGSDAARATPILYRQYVTDVINHNVPELPLWLRYGMAELFSTFESQGSDALLGLPIDDTMGLVGGDAMSLQSLLSMTRPPSSSEHAQRFVTRSWGLVHYLLVADPERRQRTVAYGRSVRLGSSDGSDFPDAIGLDVSTLESSLDAYLSQGELPHRRVQLESSASQAARIIAMEPPETLVRLGDLLIHTSPSRRQEAEAHFRKALELSPEYGPALAGLGLIRELAGDLAGARQLYASAAEKVPQGFRIQFQFGETELKLLGQRRPQSDEDHARVSRACAAFERSVELRPEYGEAWARLGYAYYLESELSPRAVPALEKAYSLLPDRTDVAFNLLLGYARVGEREKAEALVVGLPARGADEPTVTRSREILLQMDFQEANSLIRKKRYDDAVAVLALVQAATTDAGLGERVGQRLTQVEPAATKNDFAQRYLEAVRAVQAGDHFNARSLLQALASEASPGLQAEAVDGLLAEISSR